MKIIKTFIATVVLLTAWTSSGQIGNENLFIDYNNIEMPVSPNAASLGVYGETPVNAATGVPNISIPIYTLQVDGVSVPISLSYHASGILVNELATAVGLKWTLNAGGGIFRSVSGIPDENGWTSYGYGPLTDDYYDDFIVQRRYDQEELTGVAPNYNGYAKMRDHNPDNYSYSFLGNSGKYITDFGGSAIKNQADNLTISGETIKDQLGNRYNFGQNDHTEISNRSYSYAADRTGGEEPAPSGYDYDANVVTGWMLTEIITKNKDTISFDYDSYSILENELHIISGTIASGASCGQGGYAEKTVTNVRNDFLVQLITKISSDNVDILFDYEDHNGASLWKRKLTKITINDKVTGTSKEFHFVYGIYEGGGDPRLKLERVFEKKDNLELPGYSFDYIGGSLPDKYSLAQDFFGYYNGKSSNLSLAPYVQIIKDSYFDSNMYPYGTFYDASTGDRSHSPSHLQRGVLEIMTYPTGGSTKFEYQPNAEFDTIYNKMKYCGGLRVNKIEDLDNNDQLLKTTTYTYEGLEGQSLEIDLELIKSFDGYQSNPTKNIFHSSFVEKADLNLSGYFYKKVTAKVNYDGKQQKKESNFIENLSFGTRGNLLSSEIIFTGNNISKMTEYQYGRFGISEAVHWNILGNYLCQYDGIYPYWGYTEGKHLQYTGNWAMLPTQVATTDYLKQGSTDEAVTTVQEFVYDHETLLKRTEISDTRKSREVINNVVEYNIKDSNGERITIDYKYPFTPLNEGFPTTFPQGLLIRKEVISDRHTGKTFGQAFEYDGVGNIKKTFQYNKGAIGNNSTLGYVDDYEEMSTFVYENGKPVQMTQKNGVATSYIWGYNGQYPVAKIEGVNYAVISLAGHVTAIQQASQVDPYDEGALLLTKLTNLRNSYPNAMVTSYTYEPLNGVKTITDPKGERNTFFYDGFGRLLQVTDNQNMILTENEYYYAPH